MMSDVDVTEEIAQEELVEVLVGSRSSLSPALKPLLVSLALSESPPRPPRSGQAFSAVALGASLVDRVSALLQFSELDEVDLLDMLDALRSESEELPPLFLLRLLLNHPACSNRVKVRLSLKFVRRSTPKTAPVAWQLLTKHSGDYTRAAALVTSLVSSQNTGLLERISLELALRGEAGFELFSTLITDKAAESSNNTVSLADLSEILQTIKNLQE